MVDLPLNGRQPTQLILLSGASTTINGFVGSKNYPSSVTISIAGGATNREIAGTLYLSPHTVKEHTSTLYRKLGARNRADAVQRAQRLGLHR